jgi:hypothetical protein
MDSRQVADESPVATAVKAGRFPSSAVLAALEQSKTDLGEQHKVLGEQHKVLGAALNAHAVHKRRLADALRDQAGDAALASHDANKRLWAAHEDVYAPAMNAVANAIGELPHLQKNLELLIEAKEPDYNAALRVETLLRRKGFWLTLRPM